MKINQKKLPQRNDETFFIRFATVLLFMFIHFAVGTAFLIFSVIAYSRWSLKESVIFPFAMLVVLIIIWLLLYLLGRLGRSTGEKQMTELKSFMNTTLQKVRN